MLARERGLHGGPGVWNAGLPLSLRAVVGFGPGAVLVISLSGSAWDSFPVGPLLPIGCTPFPGSLPKHLNIVLICSYQELPDPVFPLLKH